MSDTIGSVMAVTGLAVSVIAMVFFIFMAFPGSGRCDIRRARLPGMWVAVGFSVWVVGLLWA